MTDTREETKFQSVENHNEMSPETEIDLDGNNTITDELTNAHDNFVDSVLVGSKPESFGVVGMLYLNNKLEGGRNFGVSQLLNVLKTVQSDDSFATPIEIVSPIVEETTENNHSLHSQTNCETMPKSKSEVHSSHIEIDKAIISHKDTSHPEIIVLDKKHSESKHIGVSRLVHVLKMIQTIQTDDSLEELPADRVLPVVEETAEKDHLLDAQIDYVAVQKSKSDVHLSHLERDNAIETIEEASTSEVIENHCELKRIGIARLVNVLKAIQPIPTDNSLKSQADSDSDSPDADEIEQKDHDIVSQTKSELETVIQPTPATNEHEEHIKHSNTTKPIDRMDEVSNVYSKMIKSHFSTRVAVDDFLKPPISGGISQNTFEFIDSHNEHNLQVDTKFSSTSTNYPAPPSCHLVSSTIHEIIYLTNNPRIKTVKHKKHYANSIGIPIHDTSTKGEAIQTNNHHEFVKIRVPVVIGEYKIELCLEEKVLFEEVAIKIKHISKNVVLENCSFTPTTFSNTSGDGTCEVLNGVLSIEGIIEQNIEYSGISKKDKSSLQKTEILHLHETITLELIIQLVQDQGIQIHYNGINHHKDQ